MHNDRLLRFLVRRLLFAALAIVVLTVIVYIMFDVPHRLERVFFHFDFGVSCSYPGCPAVTTLWGRTWRADVYRLLGGLVLGGTTGIAAAAYCAAHPRTLATRAIETIALILYSLPVYLFALGLLLLFEPTFGLLPSPVFFHPEDYLADRRVGADVRDQHGAGRVRVLHPRLPRPVEARVRPGAVIAGSP